MTRIRWFSVAVLLALVPSSGCVGTNNCTLIGCESSVNLELETPLGPGQDFVARACVDDICRQTRGTVPAQGCATDSDLWICGAGAVSDVRLILPDGTYDDVHEVMLELSSPSGEVLAAVRTPVEFERSQPNGRDCPPVCWTATVPTS